MIRFFVHGVPAPKGSTKAFWSKKRGRPVVTSDNANTRPWEQAIRAEATLAGARATVGPVRVEAVFFFPRPKGHYGAKGLKPSAPAAHVTKPDLDKLARTLLDGLIGVVVRDDSQVTEIKVRKCYVGERDIPGAVVSIFPPAGEGER